MAQMRAVFLVALLVGQSSLSPPAAQARLPIIDVHMHANGAARRPDGTPLPRLCVNDREPCDNPASKYQTDDELLRGTLEYMRRFNIVRGVLSGPRAEQWKRSEPNRFSLGAGGSVGRSTFLELDPLRAAFVRGDYLVLGEIGAQYDGIPPNDASLGPYFALAAELDIPVWIHTLGIGARTPLFRVSAGNPMLLEDVLKRHPRLRLYVENAGYPFGDQMIALLYMYPQVYVDVSTITWLIPRDAFHEYLKRLALAGFADRIMFGSDQMWWPDTIELAIGAIESAPFLTADQKRDVFFNNALRFFRWDAKTVSSNDR